MTLDAQKQEESLSKQEALDACAAEHYALITCFRTCSVWDSFVGCCKEENAVFWKCYTDKRGVAEVNSPVQWLSQKALLRAMDGELGGSLGASQAACGSLARSGPLDSVLPPGTSLGVIRSCDAVHEREA
ncbi:hypothetical protein QBZ16_002146 [Prototheca wickerhamii]|uniref:Uncharacterized protein n=1 Tax=Prototheca wickerhamii TaxID=3111 RepID=A0AAD9IL93_PROWI|nr:hypothetical protein QBZ16_002146 [Prototheca wickerhamii]